MTSASNDYQPQSAEVDVWLDVGKEGRCFTYQDIHQFGLGFGDLVRVRLRGRSMNGLVVARRFASKEKECQLQYGTNALAAVDALVQQAAVDSQWQDWLEEMADNCHISAFRMLKAALPPGWLGQRKLINEGAKSFWWVLLTHKTPKGRDLTARQKDLENFLRIAGGGAWQKELHSEGFSLGVISSLIATEVATREKRQLIDQAEVISNLLDPCLNAELEAPQPLTEEQAEAIKIFDEQPLGNALLLWGITGSGKTEVYLQIVAKELLEGRNCLILAPEIGLIPQLVDRFKRRFGSHVLEYHSGCSEKERVKTWRKILRSQNPLVVVGTRSAVFLPLSPLGLIVLDEEHDSSYKQESPMPCYHAREMALSRAKNTRAKVVLGSATPSLSTWKNLVPNGPIALARLNRRISDKPLPTVHVVDMRQELAAGHRRLISRSLMEHLSLLPEAREQAIVLVPRRGYSSFLSCRSCGEVVQCPHCDVALTVHRGGNDHQWLRCHWCDHRSAVEPFCSNCGSSAFKPFGAGTQRVIDHLAQELEGVKFLRFDRDTTGGRDGHRHLLEKFASGEADVLIGTQMLAKGIDLPRVTLAAVLAADGLLHRPDLLAGEQSLQLFMQLAGRAGRGERPGKVLIQTYCPEHPVIMHLVDGRYEEFLKKELKLRMEAGLVPFSRACLLRFSGESALATATAASALAEQIRPLCDSNSWNVVGPAPALVAKVAGKSRWQILLHGPESSPLPLPKGTELWDGLPRGVSLAIDPDPLQL
ncbi:primosomal protein N' [Prochlorococcus sp. MIT 1307]|uniref:replication restart helicase PriA n=1 Tax=Prochlorococcus sp. MIT 1307 TaxID=3096219 RepID=UPI002A748A16|nr:primosomal protein N' [Prochlorococcus sp. MIT 1307]